MNSTAGPRLARLLLSGLGLAALLYSWIFAWRYFSPPAWFDTWNWVTDFQKWVDGHYTFHDLIKPHVQHRIATTRLLLLIDSIYFGMTGYFVELCNLAGLLVLGVLLARLAMCGVPRRSAWYVPVPVWAGFVAGTCQIENLMLAFQVQFALTCCCAVGACWMFARACEPGLVVRDGITRATGGGAAMLAALFSMGSSVLLVPAVGALLWLRRAPRGVWAVFAVCAVAILLFEIPGQNAMLGSPPGMPTGVLLVGRRLLYSLMFLGSVASALPFAAPWVGAAGYGVLLALAVPPAWRRLRGGDAMPAPDAALLALALFVVLCGPAASLTLRLGFGPGAALVGRYATMSLLFWAACGAVLLRRLDQSGAHRAGMRAALVPAVAGALYFVNLPAYNGKAIELKNLIAADTALLTNDVGLQGPITELIGGIDAIRDGAVFLHRERLNMFAPGQGPRAELLAELNAAPIGSLPSCRGAIDWAMAIDDGAVLLNGWLADQGGQHTALWIAVRDAAGRIVGTARVVETRTDLSKAAGFKPPAYGFTAGFRDDASGSRLLRLAGIFPDRPTKLCEYGGTVEISGVQVQPIAELRDLRTAARPGAAAIGPGFAPGLGSAPPADFIPTALVASVGGAADRVATADFSVIVDGVADAALVMPFWTSPVAGWKSVTFVLGDGTRLSAKLAPWWGWGYWRAAVLPAALARQHGGAARVEVRDAGPGALTIAAPMWATVRPGWSRLF